MMADGRNQIIRQVWSIWDFDRHLHLHRCGLGIHPGSCIHSHGPVVVIRPCQ